MRRNLSDIKDALDQTGLLDNALAGPGFIQASVIPQMTTAARDALAASARFEGMLIYNITTHKLNVRTAAAWEVVTSA